MLWGLLSVVPGWYPVAPAAARAQWVQPSRASELAALLPGISKQLNSLGLQLSACKVGIMTARAPVASGEDLLRQGW